MRRMPYSWRQTQRSRTPELLRKPAFPPAMAFRSARVDVVASIPVAAETLVPNIVEVIVPPRPKQHLAQAAVHSFWRHPSRMS